jgi:Mycobacterium membrane protein
MDLRLDAFAVKIADGPAGGDRVKAISIGGLLKRWWIWIPLVLVIVLSVSGLVVFRLHKIFGSQDLNANAGAGIKIVQFNPKVVTYEVDGPPGSTANLNYWDADANTHQVNDAPLPWSYTISTTLPAVSANIMAQTDAHHISCRITVDGVLREHQSADGVNAQTYCLVKSA